MPVDSGNPGRLRIGHFPHLSLSHPEPLFELASSFLANITEAPGPRFCDLGHRELPPGRRGDGAGHPALWADGDVEHVEIEVKSSIVSLLSEKYV